MEQFETIDLRVYLELIKRNLRFIVVITIAMAVSSYIFSVFFMTPIYEASTSLFVGKETETDQTQLNYNDMMLNSQLVKDYQVLAKSRSVTQAVIDYLELPLKPEELSEKIEVALQADTRIIEVKVQDNDPEKAQQITNMVAQVFIAKAKEIIKVQNVQVVDPAMIPEEPVKPRMLLNVAIGTVLGLMMSVFIVFVRDFMDNTIKNPDDLERHIGIGAIGIIPHMDQVNFK